MIVCIGYPVLVSACLLLTSNPDVGIVTLVQLNCWFSVAGSIAGAFAASSLFYKKIYMHDIVFTSLAGAIAFSSSADVNFNPAAPIAIGSFVGFICSAGHTRLKAALN